MGKPLTINMRLTSILADIKTLTGGLVRSHCETRACSRCGMPLTDPGSWERGIGPVCAHKDTALFAVTIPANYAMVTARAMMVRAENLPEVVRPVWVNLCAILRGQASAAVSGCTNAMTFSFTGDDNRIAAKVIDWLLSFNIRATEKASLIEIVRHLGFVGLAGVLAGEASTGEASIAFDATTGRLALKGSSNKAGFLAMKQIPGVTIPRRRGDGSPFTVPASQHEAFFNAAMHFWPCFTGEIPALRDQALAWVASHKPPVVVVVAPKVPSKPLAKLVVRSGDVVVTFAWISGGVTPKIVEDIKKIASRERSYNPTTRAWNVTLAHRSTVEALLAPHYAVETVTTTEVTPGDTFKPSAGYGYRPRYGSAYFHR